MEGITVIYNQALTKNVANVKGTAGDSQKNIMSPEEGLQEYPSE